MVVGNRSDELEEFKTRINLTAYAASRGYELDRKSSGKNSPVMRHPNGDKVIIAKRNHWIYFSVSDPGDKGTIIDFVKNRTGNNLGQIRQELRQWTHTDTSSIRRMKPETFVVKIEPVAKDLVQVRARFEAMLPIDHQHRYLEQDRGIPGTLLREEFLRDRIRIDHRRNAVFPHFDAHGELSGYEIKNAGFTGFATGGVKGLWYTRATAEVQRLAISETAIDALSYAALHSSQGLRLMSMAGQMSPLQRELLGRAMNKLPVGVTVVIAVDNDDAGDRIAEDIRAIHAHTGREDLALHDDRPPERGADWNDVLKSQLPAAAPGAHPAGNTRRQPRHSLKR